KTTRLIPGGAASLAQLSDEELLASTRRLVGKSNQLLAALLLHLAEVELRGVHRIRRCASIYTYCIYELRFSEDAAARRSAAAKWVKQFPALLDAVADGELHLTGLLMIGPHLTAENQADVLGRARFRTKKELAKLVRELHPLPSVPDLVQPLGPVTMMKTLRTPTWAQFVESFCPPARELPPGERPRDWANDGAEEASVNEAELPVGPVPAELPPVTSPQLYQLQFSTVEQHVQLVERAKALMARERPGVSLGELHLEAMKLLVAALEKRKFAAGVRRPPRQRGADSEPRQRDSGPRQRGVDSEPPERDSEPRQRGTGTVDAVPSPAGASSHRRSRHIPAALRREVYERDAGRCSYLDARGERCGETRYLELHHLQPFARGGQHRAANLALRCKAHNRLAAERDFGPVHMAERSDGARHESLARQELQDSGFD
ncbi:MAG TPA: HNH endonuclease signature motif containing protein, partial [Polyangiaceae bacterium]|nr:HNH endonuclease signature motif containing protein [Polyangiaceae bacterium]